MARISYDKSYELKSKPLEIIRLVIKEEPGSIGLLYFTIALKSSLPVFKRSIVALIEDENYNQQSELSFERHQDSTPDKHI